MGIDVLVAGAGPVGLTMAAELARYGVAVRVVDKAAARTDKSKALVIWSRTLELIDRMGCADRFVDAGMKVHGANIVSGTEQIAHISLDEVASPHAYGLMLPQCDTERLMEEHLGSLGVRVERGVELAGFTAKEEGVEAALRHADGRGETVAARWLVGCDGAHSTVRHRLGMQFQGDTLKTDWILADLHLSGVPRAGDVNVFWHADGVLAVFPLSATRFRVIADMGLVHDETLRGDPSMTEVQELMDRRGPGGVTASDPVWLSAFRINERKVKDYRAGRVFLAGDAAHIHSPAGGQGMNTGMQDACNLAWKLALVSRGICKEEPLLTSYSVERSAVGDMVVKAAGRATAIGILQGDVKQSIRNHVASLMLGLRPVQHRVAESLTEVSIGYPKSPLHGPSRYAVGSPKVGERAPIRPGEVPVGAGGTPRFVLFADSDSPVLHMAQRFPDVLESEVRAPFEAGGMWLVRPDGYVAVATRADDWNDVSTYLQGLRN